MIKIRHAILALGMMLSPAAHSDVSVSIGIGLPHASIGVHIPAYPHLVAIPGYPVYYAPRLQANFFFYDGMYWLFQNDHWYASYWYDGPWSVVSRVSVPAASSYTMGIVAALCCRITKRDLIFPTGDRT
jgi:hypothetical protein